MRVQVFLLIAFLGFSAWNCKQQKVSEENKQVEGLFPDLGDFHNPVTTKSDAAGQFFDQGFTLIYGFNHEEAVRSFEQALKYDSTLAMAYWGIAYCYGSNYNWPADMNATRKAYDAIGKAQSLLAHVSQKEQDYINTLALRYTNDTTADLTLLEKKYSEAMKVLSEKYPEDLDAKTLYAESMMNLHPWELWLKDGTPNENTLAIVRLLEEVLAVDSLHTGANHYYIHATEASSQPEKALPSARRLAVLVPNAGHLVHMPSHVYMRTGDYAMAGHANDIAARVDSSYISDHNIEGIYPMIYYTHNLHFLAVARYFEGMNTAAEKSMNACTKLVHPEMVLEAPTMEFITAAPLQLLAGAENWQEIMKYRRPDSFMKATLALWHWARALNYVEQNNLESALAEQQQLETVSKSIPENQLYGLSSARDITETAAHILSGKLSEKKNDLKAAAVHFMKAVEAEKRLHYNEPPDWFLPAHTIIGGFYLRNGNYQQAEESFRAGLKQYPNNARDLFGLSEALKAQGKDEAAAKERTAFEHAWKNADKPLSIGNL